jgi:hypothetical protein
VPTIAIKLNGQYKSFMGHTITSMPANYRPNGGLRYRAAGVEFPAYPIDKKENQLNL